jgi:type III pantothenate kinase
MSGVMNGTIAEINGIIEQYKDTFDELKIILTGGDASFFETRIKHSIFVEPDLVLKGLNYLLQYNV